MFGFNEKPKATKPENTGEKYKEIINSFDAKFKEYRQRYDFLGVCKDPVIRASDRQIMDKDIQKEFDNTIMEAMKLGKDPADVYLECISVGVLNMTQGVEFKNSDNYMKRKPQIRSEIIELLDPIAGKYNIDKKGPPEPLNETKTLDKAA
jgi:hypothetical protein